MHRVEEVFTDCLVRKGLVCGERMVRSGEERGMWTCLLFVKKRDRLAFVSVLSLADRKVDDMEVEMDVGVEREKEGARREAMKNFLKRTRGGICFRDLDVIDFGTILDLYMRGRGEMEKRVIEEREGGERREKIRIGDGEVVGVCFEKGGDVVKLSCEKGIFLLESGSKECDRILESERILHAVFGVGPASRVKRPLDLQKKILPFLPLPLGKKEWSLGDCFQVFGRARAFSSSSSSNGEAAFLFLLAGKVMRMVEQSK